MIKGTKCDWRSTTTESKICASYNKSFSMEQQLETLMSGLFNLKAEDISDALTMKNVEGWDSLKHMELIVSLEHTFGLELTVDEIVSMQTLKDIKRILIAKAVG